MRIALFLSFFFFILEARANPMRQPITFVRMRGDYQISDELAETIMSYALYKASLVGFRPRKVALMDLPNPCAQPSNISDFNQLYATHACFAVLRSKMRAKGIVHFIMAPTIIDGHSWLWGLGTVCQLSREKPFIIGSAIDRRIPTGELRDGASKIIAAHELLHVFGADSSVKEEDGIMWIGAAQLGVIDNSADPSISSKSRNQIRGCIRKTRRQNWIKSHRRP